MPFLTDCLAIFFILIVAGCYISAFLIVIYEATMDNLAYSNIGDDTPAPTAQISQEEYEMELRHRDQMARALGSDSMREMNYIVRQDSVAPEAVAQEAPKAPEAGPIQEAPKVTEAQKTPEVHNPGNSFWRRQWELLKSIVCCK
ncbi:hypothetical protein CRE_01441 [Caenorhabditis remanei]|uniref:Uncharacterized protein n=1 Tax=Caenorhabditis remanei TaxID=31234 RepID=E3NMA2_CAERE|nr:hypothetical protein CRE_01441 [Caenorhabditis remanei]